MKPNTKLLVAPIQGVGREHLLSVEKLFPVLAVYREKSVAEALIVWVDVHHAGGVGHTAVVFSRNDEVIRGLSRHSARNLADHCRNESARSARRQKDSGTICLREGLSDRESILGS